MDRKESLIRVGEPIETISYYLCLIMIAASLFITVVSVLGLIQNTQNQAFWRMIFATIYVTVIIISIFCIGQYMFFSKLHKDKLFELFSENALLRLIRHISKLSSGRTLQTLILGFNMAFAFIIWNGDGHSLGGTWLFTAGGTPIGISLAAMVPISIQRKVCKIISVKTGILNCEPYDD